MIIRERDNDFVMIEQDEHARISGELIKSWKNDFFKGDTLRNSVEYAITKHDYGWKHLDQSPFWNDKKQSPYSFTDFPSPPKTVFYKHGVDTVEYEDPYAGLLCSKHYTRFLLQDPSPEARQFVQLEEMRRKRIIDSMPSFDDSLFQFHYDLLKLCDNFSLYICLNEPGVAKEDEHPFFRHGIPLAEALSIFQEDQLNIHWADTGTVAVHQCPFISPLTVKIRQKVVAKDTIGSKGLLNSYQEAPSEEVFVSFIEM